MTPDTSPRRPRARIAILSQGTGQFDSRAERIARTCAAAGDTVTIYARYLRGLPREEHRDGYRIVRLPLAAGDLRSARAEDASLSGRGRDGTIDDGLGIVRSTIQRVIRRIRWVVRTGLGRAEELLVRIPAVHRFRLFPWEPVRKAAWFERQVEPHDIWHGMWAASLPALARVKRRHGGATVYDARDVFLRSRSRASIPGWERRMLTSFERRWAHAADAVIQVSEQYAAMMQRDLELPDLPVVRNCPDRWDPPEPRPDLFRELLGIPAGTAVVLYQGLLTQDRGIEQAMDAILEVPDAVLVLMGFGDQNGRGSSRQVLQARATSPRYAGKVHVVDPVPPARLLEWTASADVMVMAIQPSSENHRFTTPQKLWEAMAAGVPVVASDLPGMAPIVRETGCGELCDPSSPASIAGAIRRILEGGPETIRRLGDAGLAAAHERYNWETQFAVLDGVYARLLGDAP